MRNTVLIGAQWGDEGKGKVVDVIAPRYEVIARFQGGPNAGHKLLFEGHKHVLHTIPSGVNSQNNPACRHISSNARDRVVDL